MIGMMNQSPGFRELLFSLAKTTIEAIVGNELVMQARINLSIQMPKDDSSLLHTHADTWSAATHLLRQFYGYHLSMFTRQNRCIFFRRQPTKD